MRRKLIKKCADPIYKHSSYLGLQEIGFPYEMYWSFLGTQSQSLHRFANTYRAMSSWLSFRSYWMKR